MYPVSTFVLSGVSSSLSVFGAFVIFATYFAIPEIRNFTRKLVLCLTAADLLTAGGNLSSIIRYSAVGSQLTNSTPTFCVIQGTITAYSTMVSFFFTFWIALHILTTVVTRHANTGTRCWFSVFNVLSWGIPAVIMTLALKNGAIGHDMTDRAVAAAGPWCWIKAGDDGHVNTALWRWLTVKGLEVACYLLTTTIYMTLKFYIYRHHHKQRFHDIQCSLRDEDKNFLFVWLVLYVIRVWGTLRFLLVTYHGGKPKNVVNILLHLQAIGDPAQAFCNFFLFCVLDSTVRSKFWHMCVIKTKHESRSPLIPEQTVFPESVLDSEDTRRTNRIRTVSRDTHSTHRSDYGSLSLSRSDNLPISPSFTI